MDAPTRKKRSRSLLAVTIAATVILSLTVSICVRRLSDQMTQYSFDELTASTRRPASDYYNTIQTDQVILSALAALISDQGVENTDLLLSIINSIDAERTFISYIELLLPDGRLLNRNGTWYDVSAQVDFAAATGKGGYISDRVQSFLNPNELVVCNGAPVVRNGETIAMLYGVVSLQDLSENYSIDLYDGKAFVMVVDGTTGDILLDTWHRTLGNISSMSDRKMLPGYTFAQAQEDMRAGISGDMRFISNSVGHILYLHYEPVGINNWSVLLGVTEDHALAGTHSCVVNLYWMTAIVSVTLLLYMAYVAWYLLSDRRSVYRLSITDQDTGLMNRSAYEKYLLKNESRMSAAAACVYIDANGLHEINNTQGHAAGDRLLQTVANCLLTLFPDAKAYRIGGDEFVLLSEGLSEADCTARMQQVVQELAVSGYSISYGLAYRAQVRGLGSLVLEADEKMLENKRNYYASHERRTPR